MRCSTCSHSRRTEEQIVVLDLRGDDQNSTRLALLSYYYWRTKRSGAKRRSVFLPRSGRKTWVSLYIWLTMLPKDLLFLFFFLYLVRAQNFFSRTPCEKTVQDRNKRFSQKRRWWVVDEHIINTFFEKKFWTLQKLPKVLKYAFFKILERRLRKWWQLETSRLRRK